MKLTGVVTALRAEARCVSSARIPFNEKFQVSDHALLWLSGIGAMAARAAAEGLQQQGVTALASFGVAGALDSSLKPGDLVLPHAIYADEPLPVDRAWCDRLQKQLPVEMTIVNGLLADSAAPLTDEKAKRNLAQATGACVVDMESAAVAQVAAAAGIPFIAVRAIVDPLQFSPPQALLAAVHPDGAVKPLHLTTLLLKRSVRISTLMQMGSAMQLACKTLAQVIQAAGAGLVSH